MTDKSRSVARVEGQIKSKVRLVDTLMAFVFTFG